MGGDKIQVRDGETGFGKKEKCFLFFSKEEMQDREMQTEKLEAGVPLQGSLFNQEVEGETTCCECRAEWGEKGNFKK